MIQLLAASDPSLLWIGSRSTGVTAWFFASATVLFGLAIRTHSMGRRIGVKSESVIHRSLATATVVVTVAHVALLIPDPYANLSWIDVLAPWGIKDSPVATGLGVIALWLLIAVSVAGLVRSRLSRRAWTTIHALAFAVWPLATAHFILNGTDAMTPWALGSMALVAFLLLESLFLRGFADRRPKRAPRIASSRSAAGQAQAQAAARPRAMASSQGSRVAPAPAPAPAAPATATASARQAQSPAAAWVPMDARAQDAETTAHRLAPGVPVSAK